MGVIIVVVGEFYGSDFWRGVGCDCGKDGVFWELVGVKILVLILVMMNNESEVWCILLIRFG